MDRIVNNFFEVMNFKKSRLLAALLILICASVLFTCMQQPSGANAAKDKLNMKKLDIDEFLLNVMELLYYVK